MFGTYRNGKNRNGNHKNEMESKTFQQQRQ